MEDLEWDGFIASNYVYVGVNLDVKFLFVEFSVKFIVVVLLG